MRKQLILSVAITACLAVPSVGLATNGYFAHGYGTHNKGMGGSGVAMPQNALAAATNPAGSVWVGDRADLGMAIFAPDRGYSVAGPIRGALPLAPGSYVSEQDMFLIPHFGWNTMLDDNSSFGVSVYGNGGMNTEYSSPGPFNGGTTGVDLMQLFANINYSRKWSDSASWGVGLILAAQRFEARGLVNFGGFVADGVADDLTDNGHDYSYGAGIKLGVQAGLTEWLTVGASYQSRTWMTEFDKYSDLFAEGGDFDIPPSATIGLTIRPSPRHAINFDIQRIWYGDIDSISNPMSNLTSNCALYGGTDIESCLGGNNGVGFGWEDMTVYKLGWQWQLRDDFILRLGWNYAEQPIPSSEVMFNILAPGVVEHHYTAGFTSIPAKGHELNFAVMYAPNVTVNGANPMAPDQTIELQMDQVEVELSWGWVF
jgi:long-chain fatty acid transport protein